MKNPHIILKKPFAEGEDAEGAFAEAQPPQALPPVNMGSRSGMGWTSGSRESSGSVGV